MLSTGILVRPKICEMQTYYEGDNREEEEKVGNLGREEGLSFSL